MNIEYQIYFNLSCQDSKLVVSNALYFNGRLSLIDLKNKNKNRLISRELNNRIITFLPLADNCDY